MSNDPHKQLAEMLTPIVLRWERIGWLKGYILGWLSGGLVMFLINSMVG